MGRVRAPEKKTPFSKRAESGPWVLTRGSGSGMEKPGLNPTRCHSYQFINSKDQEVPWAQNPWRKDVVASIENMKN